MIRRPPRSTRTDTLFPYPTLVRARLLHALPFETVAGRLPAGFDPALWEAVRPNLTRLAEADGWLAICRGPVVPVIADAGFAAQAAELLPPEPWDRSDARRVGTEGVSTCRFRESP